MKTLVGRKLLATEVTQLVSEVKKLPTMQEVNQRQIRCLRCQQLHLKKVVQLANHAYFCPSCIQFGRVTSKDCFYHVPEPPNQKRTKPICFSWSGKLAPGQEAISQALLHSVQQQTTCLVWAVTGAGKTEMLFATLAQCLQAGQRVGIASPRVDVCLELYPRIQAVFPKEPIALLYGKATEAYRYTKLVICTTHQLLRFYQAFDVLIIDEVDSFPYVDNPLLAAVADQATKQAHALVYLSATPTHALLRAAKQQQLAMHILPARYHRRPLPVPQLLWLFNWRKKLQQKTLPRSFSQLIERLLVKNHVLIFCPSIALMAQLVKHLAKKFPHLAITAVHAQDKERLTKVLAMRERKYQLFLTTTILERGVTFEQISVLILGANHPVFTLASLVQIAGRVDRKQVATAGEVWFIHDGFSKAMKQAIQQIKKMNALGDQQGLLDEL